jgi:3-hydroxyacyl-[acyl-carrier-protein] dehydratase
MKKDKLTKGFSLNCIELQEFQPNRYPFLMIDHVDEVIPGKSAKGFKNLTLNEWYFPDHFPGAPNMPGALQLEALAQMLTIALTTLPGNKGKVVHALSHIVRFKKEILPGDKMIIETEVIYWKRGIAKGKGVAYTNGEVACQAEMLISIPDILEQYLPKKK